MDSRIASKPESYHQIISRSLMLYRLSFSRIALFAFLMALVVFIPRLIGDIIGEDIFLKLEVLSLHRLWFFAIDIVSLVFFIAIFWRMFCFLRGKHEPLLEDLTKGAKKVLSVVLAAILQFIIVSALSYAVYGLTLLMVQMNMLFHYSTWGIIFTGLIFTLQVFALLYISTLFIFVIPLIAIENKGVLRALEGSVLLVWNHWWRVFSAQVTPWLFFLLALAVVKYFADLDVHIYFTTKEQHALTSTLVNLVMFALFIPWVAALLMTQLKDLELRKKLVKIR